MEYKPLKLHRQDSQDLEHTVREVLKMDKKFGDFYNHLIAKRLQERLDRALDSVSFETVEWIVSKNIPLENFPFLLSKQMSTLALLMAIEGDEFNVMRDLTFYRFYAFGLPPEDPWITKLPPSGSGSYRQHISDDFFRHFVNLQRVLVLNGDKSWDQLKLEIIKQRPLHRFIQRLKYRRMHFPNKVPYGLEKLLELLPHWSWTYFCFCCESDLETTLERPRLWCGTCSEGMVWRLMLGFCIACLEKSLPGMNMCEFHRKRRREQHRCQQIEIIKRGLCIQCKKSRDSNTLTCQVCLGDIKQIRKQLIRLGICASCRKNEPDENSTSCGSCKERDRNSYRQLIEKGICGTCRHNPLDKDFKSCQDCRQQFAGRYVQLKEMGLCVKCCSNAVPGFTKCQMCIDREKVHRESLRNNTNLCLERCGRERRPEVTTCEECFQKMSNDQKQRRKRRREAGICTRCDKPALDDILLCEEHRTKHCEINKKVRQSVREQGLCTYCCQREPVPGKIRCLECANKYNQSKNERYAQKTKERKCNSCLRRPVAEGKSKCERCLDVVAERGRNGLCPCGRERENSKLKKCEKCRKSSSGAAKRARADKKAQGICIGTKCENSPVDGGATCESCRAKRQARRREKGWH